MAQRVRMAAAANQAETNKLAEKLSNTTLKDNKSWGCIIICLDVLIHGENKSPIISVYILFCLCKWNKASLIQHYTGNFSTAVSDSDTNKLPLAHKPSVNPTSKVEKHAIEPFNPPKEMFIKQTEHTFTHMYKTPADGTAGCHGDEA